MLKPVRFSEYEEILYKGESIMETLKRVVVVVALLQIASSSVFAGTETSIDIVATT